MALSVVPVPGAVRTLPTHPVRFQLPTDAGANTESPVRAICPTLL